MIEFPEDYFEAEIRDGFYIEPMMKCAWAAQQEIILEVDKICKKYNIKYFADYGTLLGTIRHRGFIPWDDDVDLGMLREDYDRFMEVIYHELQGSYGIIDPRKTPNYNLPFARLVNEKFVSYKEEHLRKFHGFPYVAGVDIFPIDVLPENDAEGNILLALYDVCMKSCDKMLTDPQIVLAYLADLEDVCGIKIDREGDVQRQLCCLADDISKRYVNTDGKRVIHIADFGVTTPMQKEWFSEVEYFPFEMIQIPVPKNHHNILCSLYGESYMVPRNTNAGHDYPFYKRQETVLIEKLVKNQIQDNKLND